MSDIDVRIHEYHAESTVIEGHLTLPLVQAIKPQAYAKLPSEGNYLAHRIENYRLESVIFIRSAYTQVAGNPDPKPDHGWATLTTTVVEGLNVLDVVTADRVVAQIITEHPLKGYVPTISFLGTRFENLRIAGHPVDLDLGLDILGAPPADDKPYTGDVDLLSRISSQYDYIRKQEQLPAELGERYNQLSSTLGSPEAVECSLVNRATGNFPGLPFGHVIYIPNFGTVTLARLSLRHEDFPVDSGTPKKTSINLTMIDLELGCAVGGHVGIGPCSTNGTTRP
jgi:hypothetical protein